jgi:hypothetical protein
MNIADVSSYVKGLLGKHERALRDIAVHQTAFLELAAFVATHEHYRSHGASVGFVHPDGNTLTVKTSTRGHPSRFSWIRITSNSVEFEVHMNLPVRGAHSGGIFCVDIGVVTKGSVPRKPKVVRGKEAWRACANAHLITFAEIKKLVVYPMLLAHFVGIVHEILPRFLGGRRRRGFNAASHFEPLLLTLGAFSGTSSDVMKSFKDRSYAIRVIPAFDVRLGRLRAGGLASPFDVQDDIPPPSSPALATSAESDVDTERRESQSTSSN